MSDIYSQLAQEFGTSRAAVKTASFAIMYSHEEFLCSRRVVGLTREQLLEKLRKYLSVLFPRKGASHGNWQNRPGGSTEAS